MYVYRMLQGLCQSRGPDSHVMCLRMHRHAVGSMSGLLDLAETCGMSVHVWDLISRWQSRSRVVNENFGCKEDHAVL